MANLTVKELTETHQLYSDNQEAWKLYQAVFEGIQSIIQSGYILQHEREPDISYERRINSLYGFGYSKSIVEIFTFFLFKPPTKRKLGSLNDNEIWQMFYKDTNLMEDDFDTTEMLFSLQASILGHVGILVDKPKITEAIKTIEQQKINRIYPYVAVYTPLAILDWKWGKDVYNRPFLEKVKLKEEGNAFRIWEIDKWELWQIKEGKEAETDEAVLIDSGVNDLGYIPFFWHYNMRSKDKGVGVSDLSEIGRIELSIINNTSQIEEIINFAAFPMMLKASRDAKPDTISTSQADDEVSVQAVIEYDPEYPEAKPEWMKTEVGQSIESILDNISKKITEIYRASNIGGLAATEIQTQAKSGVALKTEFQMLNSKLVGKATNLEKTENKIVEYWLKWESLYDKFKDEIHFGRSKTFDIDNISIDLENALTSKILILSKTFNSLIQKDVAKKMLPTMSEDDATKVDKEIDENTEKLVIVPDIPDDDVDDDIIEDGMSGSVE